MWTSLVQTNGDPLPAVTRVVLGVVMFPHGAQHLLGWFGGYGYRRTMDYFVSLGIPPLFGTLAILAEFFGSLALILGLGGRVAALGILAVMVVAAVRVHLPHGFFMNWVGAKSGEGFEYHVLAAAMAALIIVQGSGLWSLDRLIAPAR